METLGDATADHQTGVMMTAVRTKLQKVAQVGEKFVSEHDLKRLQRVLDVPDVDWNKLNRDATFKKKSAIVR